MSTATQPIGVIAKLFDLSERRVQQLSREGVIPKAERGQYDLIGSVRGYVRYLRDQAVKAQAGAPDYAAERARFIRARADIAEMEAEEKRRSLIAADQIEAAWIAVLALLRTRLLGLPDRLAPQVFERSTVGETRNLSPPRRPHPPAQLQPPTLRLTRLQSAPRRSRMPVWSSISADLRVSRRWRAVSLRRMPASTRSAIVSLPPKPRQPLTSPRRMPNLGVGAAQILGAM